MEEVVKKNDFIEILYDGYSNGELFDSNKEDEIKKLNPRAKAEKTIVVVGQRMVVKGLDDSFENKEINKEYEIEINPKEGFGDRNPQLIKTIPLRSFQEQKVAPYPGMVLTLDSAVARILAISGARVITDFNNPLAGKYLKYKYKVIRKVDDEKEKCEALFKTFFKMIPEFDIKESVVIKGPEMLKMFAEAFSPKFKEIIGKSLSFELKVENKKDSEKVNDEKENSLENNFIVDGKQEVV